MDQLPAEVRRRFARYRANVESFVQDILAASVIDNADYIHGSRKIDFYEHLVETPGGLTVYDCFAETPAVAGQYEQALFERLLTRRPGLLVLIGGLGSGKSTAMRFLRSTIEQQRARLEERYRCNCSPCVRRPVIVDCIDLDRTFSVGECEAQVLMRIRRALYTQLLEEWYERHEGAKPHWKQKPPKVLRRLLIANDIYRYADAEAFEFPKALHTRALDLPQDLLSLPPGEWDKRGIGTRFGAAAAAVDDAVKNAIDHVPVAKRFTALVISFG